MVLTSIGIQPPANGRTMLIDRAAMRAVQILAAVFNVKKPLPRLDIYRSFLVADVPADVFKIVARRGPVNFQGKILAAQRAAF